MTDAVRLSDDDFRRVYDFGFKTWADLHALAVTSPAVPTFVNCATDAFLHQPPVPRTLRLKNEYERAFATGFSSWSAGGNACGLSSFSTPVQIGVTRKEPVKLSIPATMQNRQGPLISSCDENYIAILMLAWAYILSARWVEIMPEPCSISYTESCAFHGHDVTTKSRNSSDSIEIDIGAASQGEARWWAGILAQGQGWQAAMRSGHHRTLLSPWEIHLRSTQSFSISTEIQPSASQCPAPSFSEARTYLRRLCERHDMFDQSLAALAAVLLFPAFGVSQELQLPTPMTREHPTRRKRSVQASARQEHDQLYQTEYLDKCLTSSCHTKGIRPILLSVFYEPSIYCNAVTPWLQGSLAAINALAAGKPSVLWRMVAFRAPAASWLWLGAITLGLEEKLMREVGFGQMPIDLTSFAWSGTVQSFMQGPISNAGIHERRIERADECRLLFLAQSHYHSRLPVCQWRPFGSTPLEDADIEVRNHVDCHGHRLRYEGFSWNCKDGKSMHWPLRGAKVFARPASPIGSKSRSASHHTVIRDNEVVSENATRSIFGWLRFDGYAPREKPIWEHEWFAMSDSDEDEDINSYESESNDGATSTPYVRSWISSLPRKPVGDDGPADLVA
ncbi:immunoglobulin variable region used by the ITC63B heavy chain [Cordyceps javanica]|uniref:Immunoglobulin variable region used by the ITC63B heavy chain n=1 Tax=Cordyceps javanica TaxID=43265 RepID=A0A545VIF3_9HYPO|nr:immunoglobulin variable region used by the ITC63B heavy chain [Cordyceps javanica]TQW01513.1 immunoglobulin variable region used by the ITC63B heavy chain [Cordyceps javanica]